MAEPIHVDFKRKRRVALDSSRTLRAVACGARMFLDRAGVDYAVDLVIPDPKWDRRPYLMVSMAIVDPDLEDRLTAAFPSHDFDFVWCDAEDLP